MELKTRYPVYILSKGRFEKCKTAQFFIEDKLPFYLVVEKHEADEYAKRYPEAELLVLPKKSTGFGAIPVRNWLWEHSIKNGYERHWCFDDNINKVRRRYNTTKIPCNVVPALQAIEDFTDRYENIAISGMNYTFFAPDKTKLAPFVANVHVYSNLLIKNDLPFRWRGTYNADTDICLQALSQNWCTVLFNAFLVEKTQTMAMKGGNTDRYTGDGRLKMARELERRWPHIVSTDRRFQRPQHIVRGAWRKFDTPLIRRKDINWNSLEKVNDYGMVAKKQKEEIESPFIQEIYDETSQE